MICAPRRAVATASPLQIVVWPIGGPVFHFSEDWQPVVNTGITVITILMVFLIQQSRNKDSVAVHLKLNELLAAQQGASNKLVGIEDASQDDLHRSRPPRWRSPRKQRDVTPTTRTRPVLSKRPRNVSRSGNHRCAAGKAWRVPDMSGFA